MKVNDLIRELAVPVPAVDITGSAADAAERLETLKATALMVMEGNRPKGIFTSRDLIRCHLRFPEKSLAGIRVDRVMTRDLIVAEPEDTIEAAMSMMIQARVRHLPVVSGKAIAALIGLEDLVQAHVGALTRELHYLKDYISDLQDAAHD